MLLTLDTIYTKKSDIVKKYIEDEKYRFLEQVYKLENPFFLAFYEQSIECAVADAYEFFAELNCENNFFQDNLKLLDYERGHRFIKMVGLYHTIKILRKKRKEISAEEMGGALYGVYAFDDREKKLFELLYQCACRYEGQFQDLFNKAMAKYIFGKNVSNPFTLAFIQNFCYNSYYNFLSSFTKYISLNRRLKLAAN